MQIMIVGAGEVGFYLSQKFSLEGHDVVLIDQDEDKLRRLDKELDVMVLHGGGVSAQVLEEGSIKNADLFIAVTDSDEVNLVSSMIAREYGVATRVARVRNEEFLSTDSPLNQRRLGLDLLINPDRVMADEIVRMSDLSEAFNVVDFAHGKIELVGYRIFEGNPIIGKSLLEIGKSRGELGFIIVALARDGETIIPRGNDVIKAGDSIYVIANFDDVFDIEKFLSLRGYAPKKVFIIGGGRLGMLVAHQLEERPIDVKLLEMNEDRCKFLSEKLDETMVLNCDGLDSHDIIEEGIDSADLVITVTENDTTNLLASLLAKHHGARKCITKVQRPDFVPLLGRLGIDVALSPRLLVARAILGFVRRGSIVAVANLLETDSEVLELKVPKKAKICDVPLMDLDFPEGVNLGAIVREDHVIIPTGATVLKCGDEVVVFALKKAISTVEKFFEA